MILIHGYGVLTLDWVGADEADEAEEESEVAHIEIGGNEVSVVRWSVFVWLGLVSNGLDLMLVSFRWREHDPRRPPSRGLTSIRSEPVPQ